jgi:hypothetical protein
LYFSLVSIRGQAYLNQEIADKLALQRFGRDAGVRGAIRVPVWRRLGTICGNTSPGFVRFGPSHQRASRCRAHGMEPAFAGAMPETAYT